MTSAEIARNAAAIRNLAARLEAWGLSDPHQRAEHIAMNLLSDGLRVIEPPPPIRGTAELGGPGHAEFLAAKANLRKGK